MQQNLFYWRVRCVTDDRYEHVWLNQLNGEPTVCPINNTHTIDATQNTVMNHMLEQEFVMKEEGTPTQGIFQAKGFEMDVDGNVDSLTIQSNSWKQPITLLHGWFYSTPDNVGDKLEAFVATDTIIGAIGAPVSINDSVITVTSTVMDNTLLGYHLKLFDGVNQSDLGLVLGIDVGNSQVTMETPSNFAYSPLSPTYVQQTVHVIDEMFVNAPYVRYSFAEKKVGGKNVPANIPLDIRYYNRTGGAKKFTYVVEYIY